MVRIEQKADVKPVFLTILEAADMIENKLKDGFDWTDLTVAFSLNKKLQPLIEELPLFWEDFKVALVDDPKFVYEAVKDAVDEYEEDAPSDHPVTAKVAEAVVLLARNYWKGTIAKDEVENEIDNWKALVGVK